LCIMHGSTSANYSHNILLPTRATLFTYTTLFRSMRVPLRWVRRTSLPPGVEQEAYREDAGGRSHARALALGTKNIIAQRKGTRIDRKSTRLNSSHVKSSYAVFCLKKKKQQNKNTL